MVEMAKRYRDGGDLYIPVEEDVPFMGLPPRVYFTVHEVTARWGCNT